MSDTKWVSAPLCEHCWVEEQLGGQDLSEEVAIRQPVRVKGTDVETCVSCEWPTWCGIYVRREVGLDHPLAKKED